MFNYTDGTELKHHGIKGQKWGVRRYQNPDGTLTEAGKKRYFNYDGTLSEHGAKMLNKELHQRPIEKHTFYSVDNERENNAIKALASNYRLNDDQIKRIEDARNLSNTSKDFSTTKEYSNIYKKAYKKALEDARRTWDGDRITDAQLENTRYFDTILDGTLDMYRDEFKRAEKEWSKNNKNVISERDAFERRTKVMHEVTRELLGSIGDQPVKNYKYKTISDYVSYDLINELMKKG